MSVPSLMLVSKSARFFHLFPGLLGIGLESVQFLSNMNKKSFCLIFSTKLTERNYRSFAITPEKALTISSLNYSVF